MINTLTVLLSIPLYWLAYSAQKKEKTAVALLLILAGGLLLRIGVSTDPFLHFWDERYHALVAKNLLNHPFVPTLYENPLLPFNYKNWAGNFVWLHKQPLPLWAIALSMKLFGVNEFAVRIPSILLSTATIYLTFRICINLFHSNKTALLAAFFCSINGLLLDITGGRVATDHIDLFFLFFITLSVFFATEYRLKRTLTTCVLIGTSIGLAILCKWLTALIVIPIWLIIVFDRAHIRQIAIHLFVILLSAVLIFIPWEIYIFWKFPLEAQWELSSYSSHLTDVQGNQTGNYYYFLVKCMICFNELILLIVGWHICSLFHKKRNPSILALLVWFLIPLLFFSLAKTKMQAYLLFTAPALFILTAVFVQDVYRARVRNKAFLWLKYGLIILIIALPIRYAFERIKAFEGYDSDKVEQTKRIKALTSTLYSDKTVLFNDPYYIETMFYTSFISYERKPSDADISLLKAKGYVVCILPDMPFKAATE